MNRRRSAQLSVFVVVPLAAVAVTVPIGLAAAPSASEPPASEPPASEPEASEPEATEPATTEPESTEPAASDPPATEPAVSEPATSDVEPAPVSTDITDPTAVVEWDGPIVIGAALSVTAADDGAALGEPSAVTVTASVTNESTGPLDSLTVAVPGPTSPVALAKIDVADALVDTPTASTAVLTVAYADGSTVESPLTGSALVPLAVPGTSVTSISLFVGGPASASVEPGSTASIELRGTLNDAADDDGLGDGANPGVDVCAEVAGSHGSASESAEACDSLGVEPAPFLDISVLAAAATGSWTVDGANPAWTGTVEMPATGFPATTFETNSNTPTTPSGASAFLGPDTPWAQTFESTQNEPYLNLRAAAGGQPSTTTFAFASPTPVGWGFALGDIDADMVTVSAVGPSGPLTAAQLGFQGVFNYCQSTPVPSSCGPGVHTDVPVWDPATSTLIGNVVDTSGATGWFRPTVPITSLTFVFSVQSGIPIYQVWFASLTSDVTGSVTEATSSGPVPAGPGIELELGTAEGDPVPDQFGDQVTLVTDDAGTFSLTDLASTVYSLTILPPAGFETTGPATQLVDASGGDVSVAFVLARIGEPTTTDPGAPTGTEPGAPTGTEPTDGSPGPAPTTAPSLVGQLPATGSGSYPVVLIGALLLAAGAVLLLGWRARRV